jgi:hypothetical protein
MSNSFGSFLVIVLAVACGGTADTGGESGGGSSQGGSTAAGHDAGGSAGKSSGGTSHAGSNVGGSSAGSAHAGSSTGGSNVGGSNVGGARAYDPRCPAHQPMGACNADDGPLLCQYEPGNGCLCYPEPQGSFALCQQVDPNCTYVPPGAAGAAGTTGLGGAGGASAASAADVGAGGFSIKVALPPKLSCLCSAGVWQCSLGYL